LKASEAAAMAAMITGAAGGADIHVCVSAIPVPLPPPHGPGVVIDGSKGVFINNLPACRLGDTILEAFGPPNKIIKGEMTVIIGEKGGGQGPSPGPKPPPLHATNIEFEDDIIVVEKKAVTPEEMRDEIHHIERRMRQLAPDLEKAMEDAKSETVDFASGPIPYIGWAFAAIYDLVLGRKGSAAENLADEGLMHFGEETVKSVLKRPLWKVPIIGSARDTYKMGKALKAAGVLNKEMEALRFKRYRLKVELGDSDARYDEPTLPKNYYGPGGRLYDKKTGKPVPPIQGRS
jgi:uncharacterized Zn-binding protein involved in type VI secretion